MKKQLDLGCGGIIRSWDGYQPFGIDITPTGDNIKKADLAIEPIPFADNTFDLVTAYDFLEHVPMMLYYMDGKQKLQRRSVMVELFNEIYRVLKDDGVFYSQTPLYPSRSVFQDPTHVAVWTDESFNYFSGDYYGFHDHYGHTSRFEQMQSQVENDHIFMQLKAIKNRQPSDPYSVHY